jgi:hypothetical protein
MYIASGSPREGYRVMTDERGCPVRVAPEPILTEANILSATVARGRTRGLLELGFDAAGQARLYGMTAQHVGDRLAVLIDEKIVTSSPILRPLAWPRLRLNGEWSNAQAAELARRLAPPQTMSNPQSMPEGLLDLQSPSGSERTFQSPSGSEGQSAPAVPRRREP